MILTLILPELFILFILAMAIYIAREFYISKNGLLRKLMIAYFIVEVWFYTIIAFYWAYVYLTDLSLKSDVLMLYAVLIPKLIIKLKLYSYFRTSKRG